MSLSERVEESLVKAVAAHGEDIAEVDWYNFYWDKKKAHLKRLITVTRLHCGSGSMSFGTNRLKGAPNHEMRRLRTYCVAMAGAGNRLLQPPGVSFAADS